MLFRSLKHIIYGMKWLSEITILKFKNIHSEYKVLNVYKMQILVLKLWLRTQVIEIFPENGKTGKCKQREQRKTNQKQRCGC